MRRNYLNIVPSNECTGCGACSAVCPQKCIVIDEDRNGFLVPKIDITKCIHCDLCKKVCPVLNTPDTDLELRPISVFAAKNKNREISAASSSGGAFSVFAEYILKSDGTVYGVELFSEELKARHVRITDISDLWKIRGSKYLHSYASDVYPMVKADLEADRHVLFSGTPCQVAGLKHYLRKEYPKLLCIEVVCHGVPTNKAFSKYADYLQKRYKSRVVSVNFRDKSKGWNENCISFTFENGRRITQKGEDNLYTQGYVHNLFVRDSCTACKFKAFKSGADITLGDMWGIESIRPLYPIENGVSLISLNTNKSLAIFKQLEHKLKDCTSVQYDYVKTFNSCICKSTDLHSRRVELFENFDSVSIGKLIRSSLNITYTKELRKRIQKVVSSVRMFLSKIKHHIYLL